MTSNDAAKIIGEQPDRDYTLDLAKHPDLYEKTAPELASLLRTAKMKVIREGYKEGDDAARVAQTTYKNNMQRANLAILVAAGLGALMMAAQIVFVGSPFSKILVGCFGLLSAVSGALAAMWLFRVRNGQMLNAWMQKRAAAETQRLSYFAALVAARDGETPNIDLDLLRLEYFRRYQLNLQRIYYLVRGERHRADADFTLTMGSYAVVLSSLASLAVGAAGVVSGVATALGVAGVFAAALSSYANSRESMSQDRRNGERYDRTRAALAGLEGRLDEVRDAVSKGNHQALTEFVAAVNDQISLEHRQWLETTEATKEAMAKLDEALAAMQRPGGKAEASPKSAGGPANEPGKNG